MARQDAKIGPVVKPKDYKPVVLGDRVLIRPVASEQRGLLYRPETVVTQEGIIVQVGPGLYHPETNQYIVPGGAFPLKVGQRVIYGKYSGHEVEVNGERLWSMRESEIHCILEPLDS